MAKTELTLELEKKIWKETNKQGVFGCQEVTIGWWGNERVDYLTYDTKGIWRCYEIKVSRADFYSKAKKSFVGHYNYYVMPKSLYEEVKADIPNYIGVHTGSSCIKKAKKQSLTIDDEILKNSMIRSLSRENEKFIKTGDTSLLSKLKGTINKLEKEKRENHNKYLQISYAITDICQKYNLNYEEVRAAIRESI